MSKVSDPHKSYSAMQLKRDVFAAIQSTDAIREKGVTYLPKYPGEDEREYDVRKNASTIDGITASGVDVLTGAVFFDEIDTSGVNSSIVPLLENIDNKGNSFNYFCREAFKASFDGFSAIVIDMPKAQGDVRSLEDEQTFGMRPYWRLYKAKDVINWRYRVNPVSKQIQLAMIVLKEVTCEPKDRFSDKDVTRYRVFFLDGAMVKWELWRKNEEAKVSDDEFILEEFGVLTTTEIPIALIGEVTDDPKLLVEARLEVKAYQKESSYDTIEYMQIPTLWTKGYPVDAPQIALGASTHIKLPDTPDAGVGYVQIDAAGQGELKLTISGIKETIAGKVNEMIEAAVTEGGGGEQTATEAVIKDRDKQARLIVWADELKDALERALQFTAQMMGLGEDKGGEIVLRTKWAVGEEMRQQAAEMKQKSDEATIAATNAKATTN